MLKFVFVALSLALAANAASFGSWESGTVGEVQELALWSTQQLAGLAGFEGDYTIQTPRNVQKQVVNGVNYKFTLDVVVRDADNKYTFRSCDLHIFDQPWTQTRNFVEAPVCRNQNVRMAGSWVPVNAITDEIMDVARMSAKQMTSQLGSIGQYNVNRISNVQRQVVNGINYKFTVEYLIAAADNKYTFQLCDMVVNYKAWENKEQVTFVNEPVCQASKASVGGWTEQNAVTDEVMDLARWSTSQLSAFTGIKGDHTVMSARNVKTQVVSGINYSFTVDLVVNNSETGKYTFQSCDLTIFTQSWTNTKQITSANCRANPQ